MTSHLRLAAAALSVAALSACSGSSGSAGRTTPSPTPTPLTLAQAKTVAAAGVLTAEDFPGYTSKAQTNDPKDDAFDATLATCLGVATPTYLTREPGRAYTKGDLEVDSSVDVAPTRTAAAAQLAALQSTKAPECIKAQFTKLFTGSGLTVSAFDVSPATATVAGADASSVFRFSVDASSGGQPVQIRGVVTQAIVGQAEISVAAIGSPTQALTVDETTALLAKAVGRVRSA